MDEKKEFNEKVNKKKRSIENDDDNESNQQRKKIKLENSHEDEIDYDNLEKILKDDPLFFS
tara:strand:- start:1588 stop:1770 length:183 start_codon:yes stop_codon:yes gene_type:complete